MVKKIILVIIALSAIHYTNFLLRQEVRVAMKVYADSISPELERKIETISNHETEFRKYVCPQRNTECRPYFYQEIVLQNYFFAQTVKRDITKAARSEFVRVDITVDSPKWIL